LRDTVSEFEPASGRGNGFLFEQFQPEALEAAAVRAVNTFRNPAQWRQLMDNCFKADFSWSEVAQEYLNWFNLIHGQRSTA